ncbi:MAG: carboxypeptidase-like regulatory domain-containing protein, partial [Chitinophagaceae bacterium]|nr:carboxypeptidase-like regulatory domain-containing protein [Chitinophagaceae bacterium]
MKKRLLFWAMLMISGIFAMAQQIKVSGRVISAANNGPVPGISVLVKGTKNGTFTNENGEFSLSVPKDGILSITGVGFAAKDVAATEGFMEISLDVVNNNLTDV